jgi:hypothetical protein
MLIPLGQSNDARDPRGPCAECPRHRTGPLWSPPEGSDLNRLTTALRGAGRPAFTVGASTGQVRRSWAGPAGAFRVRPGFNLMAGAAVMEASGYRPPLPAACHADRRGRPFGQSGLVFGFELAGATNRAHLRQQRCPPVSAFSRLPLSTGSQDDPDLDVAPGGQRGLRTLAGAEWLGVPGP